MLRLGTFPNYALAKQAYEKPDGLLHHRIQLGSLYFDIALYSVVNILRHETARSKPYSYTL